MKLGTYSNLSSIFKYLSATFHASHHLTALMQSLQSHLPQDCLLWGTDHLLIQCLWSNQHSGTPALTGHLGANTAQTTCTLKAHKKTFQETQFSGKLLISRKKTKTNNTVLTEVITLNKINQRYLKKQKWKGHYNKGTHPTWSARAEPKQLYNNYKAPIGRGQTDRYSLVTENKCYTEKVFKQMRKFSNKTVLHLPINGHGWHLSVGQLQSREPQNSRQVSYAVVCRSRRPLPPGPQPLHSQLEPQTLQQQPSATVLLDPLLKAKWVCDTAGMENTT